MGDLTTQEIFLSTVKRAEGFRSKPYRDTVGKLTIGYGRNLDDVGISEWEASLLFDLDVQRTAHELIDALPWIAGLDEVRRAVLVEMAFNMGVAGLLQFKNTLALVRKGMFAEASRAMLDSKWAGQVGHRADRLAESMRLGVWVTH